MSNVKYLLPKVPPHYNATEETLYWLDRMIDFQTRRSKMKDLTPYLIEEGLAIFGELTKIANTPELKELSDAYLRFLNYEKEKL